MVKEHCLRAVISDTGTFAEKKGKVYFTIHCRDTQEYVCICDSVV